MKVSEVIALIRSNGGGGSGEVSAHASHKVTQHVSMRVKKRMVRKRFRELAWGCSAKAVHRKRLPKKQLCVLEMSSARDHASQEVSSARGHASHSEGGARVHRTGENIEFGGSGGSWWPSGLVGGCVGDVPVCTRTGLGNLWLSGAGCGGVEASWGLVGGFVGNLKGRLGFLWRSCPEGKGGQKHDGASWR